MDSFFKTVTSINSDSQPQLSKPLKCNDKSIRPQDMVLYQAAQQKCATKQEDRLKSPLFQVTGLITNAEPMHKNTVKQTQLSNQPTSIFDFSENRKEQHFKPHCIKVPEPGNGSDQVYRQQLKSNQPTVRNPIIAGDPKSEYIRSTKTPMPKNQIKW